MKIGRFFLLGVGVIGLFILFGDRGLRDNYAMRERLQAVRQTNAALTRENATLQKTARLLQEDLAYIESVARNELGMVKPGDIVYRLTK